LRFFFSRRKANSIADATLIALFGLRKRSALAAKTLMLTKRPWASS